VPILTACKLLSLSSIANNYEQMAMDASMSKISYQEYLYKLLQQQIIDRVDRSVNAKIKKAGFPYIATLQMFDFSFQPTIDEKLLRELATLNFLSDAKNILLVGAPGVGKTHLAIALGLEAAKQRRRVKFITAEELTNELIAARQSNTLVSYLEASSRIELPLLMRLDILIFKKSQHLFFLDSSQSGMKRVLLLLPQTNHLKSGQIYLGMKWLQVLYLIGCYIIPIHS
jgi:DNA replication protein DnaC